MLQKMVRRGLIEHVKRVSSFIIQKKYGNRTRVTGLKAVPNKADSISRRKLTVALRKSPSF